MGPQSREIFSVSSAKPRWRWCFREGWSWEQLWVWLGRWEKPASQPQRLTPSRDWLLWGQIWARQENVKEEKSIPSNAVEQNAHPHPSQTHLLGKHRNRSSLANSPFYGEKYPSSSPSPRATGVTYPGKISHTPARSGVTVRGPAAPTRAAAGVVLDAVLDAVLAAGGHGELSPGPASSPRAALPAAM